MAPEFQAVVYTTQTWLRSTWHVQVPFAWLEACVQWLQEEAGGAGRVSQQQINQQALDQWLLTDLRDLDYPVLPEGLSQAEKTELNGTFCVQVDSLLDISQPAYGQLQKVRGTDCANDEVSAVTQATQRPWEARASRMLLLQVTDGVQSLEAMEYQPIPALSTTLRPGVKLQLQGKIVCRLGVLLLGPANVSLLGGEVEELVDRNNQGRVLCRALGLPEEEQPQQEAEEEAPPALQQGNQEVGDLELDDDALLASLEAEGEVGRVQGDFGQDSGYSTFGESSTQSSRSSSIRNVVSAASSRSILTQSTRDGSIYNHHLSYEQEHSDLLVSDHMQEIQDYNMDDEDFPDEEFDNLPLDEWETGISQESTAAADRRSMPQNNRVTRNPNRATKPQTAQCEQKTLTSYLSRLGSRNSSADAQRRSCGGVTGQLSAAVSSAFSPAALEPPRQSESITHDDGDFMDEDMDCLLGEVRTESTGESNQLPVQPGPSAERESTTEITDITSSSERLTGDSSRSVTPQRHNYTSSTADRLAANKDPQSHSSAPAVTLTSTPFTYLCLLKEMMSKPDFHTTEIHLKAFIVTLLGKLSSRNGLWRVCAMISDGTGYLDVELSDEVLTGLLGFSVAEKGILKRDPVRRGELDTGMRRCLEELVDMCCVMTVVVEPEGGKAVVTKAEPVTEKVLQELEQRVKDRKK